MPETTLDQNEPSERSGYNPFLNIAYAQPVNIEE